MLDVLLAVSTINAADEVTELDRPELTADLAEFVQTATSNKTLARMMTNALHARVNGADGRSRDYLLHSADLPVVSQTTTTYLLSSQFASPRSSSLEALKNSFNVYSFTPHHKRAKRTTTTSATARGTTQTTSSSSRTTSPPSSNDRPL